MKLKISTSDVAAIGTWLVVFSMAMYLLPYTDESIKKYSISIISLFIIYLVTFLLTTRENLWQDKRHLKSISYFLQLCSAFAIMILWPLEFLPILTIIWVAILPYFFSIKRSFLLMFTVITLWYLVHALLWGSKNLLMQALLYSTFHFFAIMMTVQNKQAEMANDKLQSANRELKATHQLLAEASKQNERTRIARDLHDLLGHHLTALIINLQVATYTSKGEAKEKIEQCHSLAKLLLSDVREAVSTLRENQHLNFTAMVEVIIQNVPSLKINTDIQANLDLEDLDLAKALLSCIQEALTNSLRHANANEFWISIYQTKNHIQLELYDNGQIRQTYCKGNGLKGMQERVELLKGAFSLNIIQNALQIKIVIPHKPLENRSLI